MCRRLVASLAQSRGELDRERKGADDLRREIQSYISHVRQVESILARKVCLNFFLPLNIYLEPKSLICVLSGRRKGCPLEAVPSSGKRDEQFRYRTREYGAIHSKSATRSDYLASRIVDCKAATWRARSALFTTENRWSSIRNASRWFTTKIGNFGKRFARWTRR